MTTSADFKPAVEYTDDLLLKMFMLTEQIEESQGWCFCNLMDRYRRASEMELMVAQTLAAATLNLEQQGYPFSFAGSGVRSTGGGGLVDNATAFGQLVSNDYFVLQEFGGQEVIWPTEKLILMAYVHLSKKMTKELEAKASEKLRRIVDVLKHRDAPQPGHVQ